MAVEVEVMVVVVEGTVRENIMMISGSTSGYN